MKKIMNWVLAVTLTISCTQTTVRTGSVETGKWYDVKLTVAGDNVKAWLDNEIVFDIILKKTPYCVT